MKRVTKAGGRLVEPLSKTGTNCPDTRTYLNSRYHCFTRKLAYPEIKDRAVWRRWRSQLRRALRKTLRLDKMGRVPVPRPVLLDTVDCGEYRREKVAYETLEGNWVTAYLLIPHASEPMPGVLCPHGHVPGAKDNVVGITDPMGVAYGHELASRGLVVLAPDNAGMGERDAATRPAPDPLGGCYVAWARLNHMGLDLTGLRVFDLMAGLNMLAERTDVLSNRIGCAGLSGGCWLTQILAALDSRIRAVILSGFFTTFVQTVWHGHCVCHHPFGIGTICDLPDLSALIAPRPQFVESGTQDTAYPHEPAFSMVKRAYQLLGMPENLHLHRYRGGHEFCGKKSIPWLVRTLKDNLQTP